MAGNDVEMTVASRFSMNKAQATISAVIKYRGKCKSFVLERVPIGWNHPIDKNSLQINKLSMF